MLEEIRNPSINYRKLLLILTSIIIWVGDLIVYQYWYRAYKFLGWWPSYSHPSPKELGWEKHHFMVNIALSVVWFSVILWIITITFSKRKNLNYSIIIIGILGVLFFLYLLSGNFFEWYAD